MTTMSADEIARLAALGHALRPDWPTSSLRAGIPRWLPERSFRVSVVAMAIVATDPATDTPARVAEAGPWWPIAHQATADRGPGGHRPHCRRCREPHWRTEPCQPIEPVPADADTPGAMAFRKAREATKTEEADQW